MSTLSIMGTAIVAGAGLFLTSNFSHSSGQQTYIERVRNSVISVPYSGGPAATLRRVLRKMLIRCEADVMSNS